MNILFHLGHPAHFHLFKHLMRRLQSDNHEIHILIKEKDVLRDLLDHTNFSYVNILIEGKTSGKMGMVKDLYRRGYRMLQYCREHTPDLLIGTSADISYVGRFLNIPAINVQEDDASVIPLHAWIAYPWATAILSPTCCDNGRWEKKTISYRGYHELAYLHPDLFTPDSGIVKKYTDPQKPFFILRFASLHAHHDSGVRGLNNQLALDLIDKIGSKGKVIISSERELPPSLEPYRQAIDPVDLHHLLAFANLVIGDSQTMSAEAGVLGTPFIRFNDFVGKIGYLKELEEVYQLGFGITPDHPEKFLNKAEEIVLDGNTKQIFKKRQKIMLSEKINVTDFLLDYIMSFKTNK